MDSFTYLFSHFFWLIFPVFGMGMGAFAIWTEHRRQVKGLELLRTYAEQGKEPPQAVLDALPRIAESRRANRTRQSYGASFVLMLVLVLMRPPPFVARFPGGPTAPGGRCRPGQRPCRAPRRPAPTGPCRSPHAPGARASGG